MTDAHSAKASDPNRRNRRGSAAETRLQIIVALVELLEEFTTWDISISMLTRRVGVSSQLFYRHFSSLDDVLAAHWEHIQPEVPDLEPILGGDWPDDEGFARLRQVSDVNLAFWNRHRTAMRVLGMLDDMRKPTFATFREMRGRGMAESFIGLIRRRKAGGHLPLDLIDANVAWEITARIQLFGLNFPQVVALGTPAERAIDIHTKMLAISLGFAVPLFGTPKT